ncbi:MAG TPA: hypothetical protein VL025_19440 [Thermoanaerobaculia bacterium]|nr:hypothetical protein [Thermoanaerobaculia bacterium]
MLRILASVIVGYLVLLVCMFALLTGAYLAMGTERAFQPGSYQVTLTWVVVSFVLSFAVAIVGGLVSRLVARTQTGPRALAVVVLVLGFAMCAMIAMSPPPPADRPGDVPNMEAMQKAQTPLWVALLNPLVGAAGVLLGGRLKKP